ncbi:MAG: Membrane protein insertase, YidC/Oxa1 family [Candidatus Magasanikbacteria bacterium GW2011_GWC2_40_17]|uniref:Membrane protein insertase, YidC/Oxa1 family n=1 Tax=Candidatus Magasanikbacteria bacterium GW2011_GWA2_42_32 TaxID=1619039 RepID=A0A0G1D4G8_9BACT|nr:MAG: Membrane protein insertase, YidC/Oxa1 family [Candidatus Magasanikbacteria bacterium GW2011_GWC2_40_17]KKS56928.1 MAG: Membrane protein insertase, YidC/Oxa1 family [Candidatus Magasanikbacteria bacterium GW2011_GWA2_42_32]OGH85502.1 MAG: hypothetical protein A2294_03155 [Candidatus Magasanikbacteria bacterium RIFOXYB2_FULL_38_10]
MDFLGYIWTNWLYIPVFNALIWLYNGPAKENLGYAVIILTIGLRLVLLPFSIVSERNKIKYNKLSEKVGEMQKDYKKDPEALKEKVRELLKKSKVNPWAKILVLAIQALMLVLLYQVFIGGIARYKLNVLYPTVEKPEIIYTQFYGFELGIRDWRWAAVVGLVLFAENYLIQRKVKPNRSEQLYAIFFPIMSFLLLWALPMVKSIFILTSLAFSYFLSLFKGMFAPEKGSEVD